jgi:prepilin-type N-terminal cleavage/methylation domain-containing protein
MKRLSRNRPAVGGFSLIEVLVVVGIMGMLLIVSYPSILNTMAARNLDNTARKLQTFLHQTKLQAVSNRIPHRVRFTQDGGAYWTYDMERLQADGTWIKVPGAPRKTIPAQYNVTLALPPLGADYVIIFAPYGSIGNFVTDQNFVVLQAPKLDRAGQMDERVISFFLGGSIQFAKREST